MVLTPMNAMVISISLASRLIAATAPASPCAARPYM
jgi:hypothetical protein